MSKTQLPPGLRGWEPTMQELEEALQGKDIRYFRPVLEYYQENGRTRQLRNFCKGVITASASPLQH